jgi:purine-binding chemotaxis protein CheW
VSRASDAVEDAVTTLLLCRVATRLIGLPLAQVVETMRPLPIEAIARAPRGVRGLSIVRGTPVPVVDVRQLLDDEHREPDRFVTLRAADRTIALAVDAVHDVRRVRTASLQNLPPLFRAEDGVVSTVATVDAALCLVLQSARLVPNDLALSSGVDDDMR